MVEVKLISLGNNSNLYINVPKKSEFNVPTQNGNSTNIGGRMAPSNYEYQNTKGDMAPYSYDGGCEGYKDYAYGVEKGVSPYNHQSGYNGASGYNHEGGNRKNSAYKNYNGECKGYNSYAQGGGKAVSAYQKTYQSAPENNCGANALTYNGYYDDDDYYDSGVDNNLGGNNYYDSSSDDDYYARYPYQPSNENKSCGWLWW